MKRWLEVIIIILGALNTNHKNHTMMFHKGGTEYLLQNYYRPHHQSIFLTTQKRG